MKSFSDMFPPPRFLEMPAVGIDISEDAIRFVEFARKGTHSELKKYGKRPLPLGIIKNGEIADPDQLKTELKKLREEQKFDFAHLSLPEEKAYIFRTTVALAEPAHVHDSIEFLLEENVPLSIPEAIFDYSIVRAVHKDTSHLDVVVVVVPRQYVVDYANLVREAGLFPLSLQIVPTAITRSAVGHNDHSNIMIVHFYREKTGITIVSRGVVQFTSTIGIGGDAFTKAIEKYFNVSTEEARRIKRNESFVPNKERVELFYSLMNTVSALKDEIQRLFVYWQTFKGRADELGGKIERVILCGEDALITGIDEYLSISLHLPVEVADLWKNIFSFDEYVPAMKHHESLEYAVSIGLALPGGN